MSNTLLPYLDGPLLSYIRKLYKVYGISRVEIKQSLQQERLDITVDGIELSIGIVDNEVAVSSELTGLGLEVLETPDSLIAHICENKLINYDR